jgi:hypothetical protein
MGEEVRNQRVGELRWGLGASYIGSKFGEGRQSGVGKW